MEIHLTNGLKAEIDEAEAERIAGELALHQPQQKEAQ